MHHSPKEGNASSPIERDVFILVRIIIVVDDATPSDNELPFYILIQKTLSQKNNDLK